MRQKDISIGAGLMFVGGIIALLWSFVIGTGQADVLLPQAFFILGFTLAFVLLFFHPLIRVLHKTFSNGEEQQPEELSKQQNSINLGAILMFIGTLKALMIASFGKPESRFITTLFIMTAGFLILLIVRKAVEIIYRTLFKADDLSEANIEALHKTGNQAEQLDASTTQNVLPAAHSDAAEDYIPLPLKRVTAKVTQPPPMITEETTKFLDES